MYCTNIKKSIYIIEQTHNIYFLYSDRQTDRNVYLIKCTNYIK